MKPQPPEAVEPAEPATRDGGPNPTLHDLVGLLVRVADQRVEREELAKGLRVELAADVDRLRKQVAEAQAAQSRTQDDHLSRLGTTLDDLRQRVATGENHLRSQRDDLARALQGDLAADLESLGAQLRELLEARGKAQVERLALIDGTLGDLQRRAQDGEARLRALDQRVTQESVDALVERATRLAADRVYKQEFEERVTELSDAFLEADDRLGRLRAYIDQFGPGGLPVLKQANEALTQRVEDLGRELARSREEATHLQRKVAELDAAAIRRQVEAGIDPAVLERRLRELEQRDRDVADRESLSSENARLRLAQERLQEQLRAWEDKADGEHHARAEQAELRRLRDEVEKADAARSNAERARVRAEQRALASEQEAERARTRLLEVEVDAASAKEREARLVLLTTELKRVGELYERGQAQLSEGRRSFVELETAYHDLSNEHAALRVNFALTNEQARAEAASASREEVERARASLDAWAQSQADIRAAEHRSAAERLARRVSELEDQAQDLRDDRDGLREALARATAEAKRLEAEMESVRGAAEKRIELYEAEISDSAKRDWEQRQAEAARLLADAKAEETRMFALADQAQEAREAATADVAQLAAHKGVIEAELEGLRRQIDDLRVRVVPEDERAAQLHVPVFQAADLAPVGAADEAAWLREVERAIDEAGFTFHPRLVRAFHTSLKIAHHAPLVVLAGISGTGKSELPRLYADLGGVPFLEMAVQPSWDSPADLFGFFNYTDGRLKAEPLARLLAQVAADGPLRQSPSMVLLDEMNLARVEYYFADLLSKLEARRGVRRLGGDAEARRRASISLDVGPGASAIPLYLDERVLFVGTMNEDESTLTLSDKVLDRACVLTFPAPLSMQMTEQRRVQRRAQRVSWETWQGWIRDTMPREESEQLNAINEVMGLLRRPFGHRLFRAIHAYLANYPGETADAWADQFAMKIIPRLRGLECDAQRVRDGLDELAHHVPAPLADAFAAARDHEFFTWAGASDLYRVDR